MSQNSEASAAVPAKADPAAATQGSVEDSAAVVGRLDTPAGLIPLVSPQYRLRDRLASWQTRWGMRRMNCRVKPGLYALGTPSATSPVFATANYKPSFDAVRTNLKDTGAWILVLDTNGVNVWCAAGKGTFGTPELVRSIMETGLTKAVAHKSVILPQLGGPGVAAHVVKASTGFSVAYGPVRAEDMPEFLRLGKKVSPEMRRVRFDFSDRMILAPVQLVQFSRYLLPAALLLYLLGFKADAALTLAALFAGAVVVPALLPWLPGRSFAVKGAAAGLAVAAALSFFMNLDIYRLCVRTLVYIPIASFIGLDFTGASTYTSPSGVVKELRLALPAQALALLSGLLMLWLLRKIL